MHVSIAIVGFRNCEDIVRCLAALEQATYPDYEIVICENGGHEAHAALQQALPERMPGGQAVKIVQAPCNLGFAGGVNVCLAESPQADAWWLLNPDTLPQPQALAAMAERLSGGDCDAVGCVLQLSNGKIQSYGGHWQPWLARAVSIGHGGSPDSPVDGGAVERLQNYLNGASMLVSRRFVDVVGLMREDYFLYCEEVEWCLRAVEAGGRIGFAADAVVLHHQGATTGAGRIVSNLPRLPVYLGERNKLLVTRDRYPLRLPIVMFTALAILVFRNVRGGAWRQLGYALAGWSAGLLNKRGAPGWLDVGRRA